MCKRPKERCEVQAARESPTGFTIPAPTRKAKLERQRFVSNRNTNAWWLARSGETLSRRKRSKKIPTRIPIP
jgi:hypothetical protein